MRRSPDVEIHGQSLLGLQVSQGISHTDRALDSPPRCKHSMHTLTHRKHAHFFGWACRHLLVRRRYHWSTYTRDTRIQSGAHRPLDAPTFDVEFCSKSVESESNPSFAATRLFADPLQTLHGFRGRTHDVGSNWGIREVWRAREQREADEPDRRG